MLFIDKIGTLSINSCCLLKIINKRVRKKYRPGYTNRKVFSENRRLSFFVKRVFAELKTCPGVSNPPRFDKNPAPKV